MTHSKWWASKLLGGAFVFCVVFVTLLLWLRDPKKALATASATMVGYWLFVLLQRKLAQRPTQQ
jgi:hypothetical protein